MKKVAYIISFIVACAITFTVHAQHSSDMMWYGKPAINFNEALPVGNGRMGGMVYGRVQDEYISLNEQTLWSGGPNIRWNNPNAKNYLSLVRAAVLSGEYKKADSLAKFMQGPYTESYMPMADMHILYNDAEDNLSSYKRSLNLDSAMAVTTFTHNAVTYTRTVFASFPGRVMVIHNTANTNAAISFTIKVTSKLHYNIKVSGNEIILSGKAPQHVEPVYLWKIKDEQAIQYGDEGMAFQLNIKVNCKGGKVTRDDSSLTVLHADDATILVTAATSFNGYDKSPSAQGKNPAIAATNNMRQASAKTYTQLLQQHIADYTPIYRRVQYSFGDDPNADMPTDERLRQMPDKFDAQLMATIVQYGRYLLITSSRPGGQPANLKGLWNERLRPEYSANWCIDHDAQMFYYAAETNNLSEMHEPFLQLIRELSTNGYITASVNYGMQGWCAHHNTDLWRKSSPVGNWGEGSPHWATWNMSGPWLCQHYFEHYLFTGDTSFLRKQAWPIMQGAALFCLNWLIPDGAGHLISVPSVSPENTFITAEGDTAMVSVNTTGDIELMKDLFSNCLQTAKMLNIDNTFVHSLQRAYNQLAPYPIGSKGQLLEWQHEWNAMDPAHRHLTHMFAVFPGSEISTLLQPSLANAAKIALALREKTNGSWGFAWKAACWARLHEADSAWRTLGYQLRYVDAQSRSPINNLGLYPNLFNSEVPGVILNGNTCITAAVTEMLLQSQSGIIELLPALPAAFKTGSVKGLVARGGFEVSINWQHGMLVKATLLSKRSNRCRLELQQGYKVYADGKVVAVTNEGNNVYSFEIQKNLTYIISKNFASLHMKK